MIRNSTYSTPPVASLMDLPHDATDPTKSHLQQDISRTLKSCDHMLMCFTEWQNWSLVTQGQKKLLQKALDGTIVHLEESLSQVELQIRNAANRGDSRAVQSWDLWRAQIKQKRNALQDITQRLL